MSKTTVTVAQVPGKSSKVELEGAASLQDVMSAAGLAFAANSGLKVSVNGVAIPADKAADTPVKDKDVVTASKGARGA